LCFPAGRGLPANFKPRGEGGAWKDWGADGNKKGPAQSGRSPVSFHGCLSGSSLFAVEDNAFLKGLGYEVVGVAAELFELVPAVENDGGAEWKILEGFADSFSGIPSAACFTERFRDNCEECHLCVAWVFF